MATRFNAVRGETLTLTTSFIKYTNNSGVLTDPYQPENIRVDILNNEATALISGVTIGGPGATETPAWSGLVPSGTSTGVYEVTLELPSGMQVGLYRDQWQNVQFTVADTPQDFTYGFSVRYNDEDLSDWDVLPG